MLRLSIASSLPLYLSLVVPTTRTLCLRRSLTPLGNHFHVVPSNKSMSPIKARRSYQPDSDRVEGVRRCYRRVCGARPDGSRCYGAAGVEAPAMAGEEVYVVGGANSAGQAALHLARFASRVTLLVRGGSLAAGVSDYLIRQIEATPNLEVRLGTRVVDGRGEVHLKALALEDVETRREDVAAAALFVMIGAEPRTEWLRGVVGRDDHGFVLTGRDVPQELWTSSRPPLPFETSVAEVFAAGDVRYGSVKRVAGAVAEGSVAVGSVHRYIGEQARIGATCAAK
jgi:Pyridine nucleotide-disulphide oxidoreductase